jgi:hypothetical protein
MQAMSLNHPRVIQTAQDHLKMWKRFTLSHTQYRKGLGLTA